MRSWKWWLPLGGVVLVVVAACCYPLARSTYLLRGLRTADEQSRPAWASAVAHLGTSAVEPLFAGLDEPAQADNCAAALEAMVEAQTVPLPRLAEEVGRSFARRTPEGRSRSARLLAAWIHAHPEEPTLYGTAVTLLPQCVQTESEHLDAILGLTLSVLSRPCDPQILAIARGLAQKGLASKSVPVRVRAVTLCMQPGVDLLPPLVPLLRDPAAEVRRAAVLALGPVPQAISNEALLACLNDTDAQVSQIAHSALLARGLQPEQVELGRLLTHPHVRVRLQVLDRLPEVSVRDPLIWVRQLSDDRSPAVRAATARAMAALPQSTSGDRLEEMARSDPSPTVAWIARFYLAQRNRVRPAAAP